MPGIPSNPNTLDSGSSRKAGDSERTQPEKAVVSDSGNAGIDAFESRKRSYNASILQANYEVNLNAKNEPQALVYKAAIDAINKELEGELGENAIERGAEQGLDVSPEATAERIVRLSTNLYDLYRQNNPDLSDEEQLNRFIEVISSGIDQGFGEAKDILDGLGVLEGEIEENIDKTYELVQQGLAEFRERIEATLVGDSN